MNNILVETDKKLTSGFKIAESDIRRLVQLSHEQMSKFENGKCFSQYIIKSENGTVAKTTNVNDIFIDDNLGSNKIIMLVILTSSEEISDYDPDENDEAVSSIRITFNDIRSENNSASCAMRYKVKGISRDWVMVTSSLIEERLIKLQRKLFAIGTRKIYMLVMVLLLLVLTFLISSIFNGNNYAKRFAILEEAYKAGKYVSTNDLLIAIEKTRIGESGGSRWGAPMWAMLTMLTLAILAFLRELKWLSFNRIYPLYNFCWGDYLEEFKKIEKRRRFIIGLIVFTIILGVAVNLISNIIWKRVG